MQKGFTLAETIIAVGIMVTVSIAVAGFAKESMELNRKSFTRINNNFEVSRAIKIFVNELRSAENIVSTSTNEIIFNADLDNNGVGETIRFFRDTDLHFKRLGDSGTTTLIALENSSSTPLFTYNGRLILITIVSLGKEHNSSVVLRNIE